MRFFRKKHPKVVADKMTKDEFLAVLTAIVVQRRLSPPQRRGFDSMAFSSPFARMGHFDGGPAFIRVKIHLGQPDGERGPICEACRFLTGKNFSADRWRDAARTIGLSEELARRIQDACELSTTRDPHLYRKLLTACGLPQGENDDEDILLAISRRA